MLQPEARLPADGAPVQLNLVVLGVMAVRVAGQPVAIPGRKARAVLGYLALEGDGAATREALAGLLWGETGDAAARGSLRQALLELRQALGPRGSAALQVERHEVRLRRELVQLDVTHLLASVAAAQPPDDLPQPEQLLHGFEDLSPLFSDWLRSTRNALQRRFVLALEKGFGDEEVDRARRRQLAEVALRIDPLHEHACRVLMRLAAEDGEPAVALRAYGDLFSRLESELDAEPSQATQALVADIKQERIAAVQAAPRAADWGVPVVAVLPLRIAEPHSVPPHVADGIVEDIVAVLASLREPVVISASSTRGLEPLQLGLAQIGQRLGARYLVSGAIRASGAQRRLSLELVEAANGAVLWSRNYDAPADGLFSTQDRIAAAIAHSLAPQVQRAELARSLRRPPNDLGAYHLVLQARELVYRLERPSFERAGSALREAIARDPSYAGSRTAHAAWLSLRIGQGWSEDAGLDAAALEAEARLAMQLDPAAARAMALLAHSRTILARDYDAARGLIDAALDIAPNDAECWLWSSPTFAFVGEAEEAVRRAERAIALSPQDPLMFRFEHFLSIALYAAGDAAAAAHWGRASLQRNPRYTSALRMTAGALAAVGQIDEAHELAARLLELEPRFSVARLKSQLPFLHPAVREAYAQHLIRAGLPQ